MVSRFDEKLPILEGRAKKKTVRLGVCAMGPVADGDKLVWMQVWVWQQNGKKVVAASGTGGEHLGAHERSPREKLPFTSEKGWMIQTQLEKDSEQFTRGKPALAMALAVVEHADGSRDVQEWSQAVAISARRGYRPK